MIEPDVPVLRPPELDCFPLITPAPKLVPASLRRDWMDHSVDRFAYRCTPLSIANAAGWELLNPVAFSATWTGWNGSEDIIIRPHDPDHPPRHLATNFGHGILTFHPGYLFRTSPGWSLQVRGSPNRLKDGVAPLDAIVETEWLSFTFTMNWKFTRPGTVHFGVDEPFCFITPVCVGALEAVRPAVRDLARDAPDLHVAFSTWQDSRSKVQASGAGAWQKHYLHGRGPSGDAAPQTEHRTKLSLATPRQTAPDATKDA